ncbi:MAG: hypothetical protein AMXMBFR64_39390 [Myxococcales bacterium]
MSANDLRPEENLLTPSEAAARFRVSPRTLARWRVLGLVAHTRTPGGSYRYREGDVQGVIEARRRDRKAA